MLIVDKTNVKTPVQAMPTPFIISVFGALGPGSAGSGLATTYYDYEQSILILYTDSAPYVIPCFRVHAIPRAAWRCTKLTPRLVLHAGAGAGTKCGANGPSH